MITLSGDANISIQVKTKGGTLAKSKGGSLRMGKCVPCAYKYLDLTMTTELTAVWPKQISS